MDFDQFDRLEGSSGNQKGGLIIKKKNPSNDDDIIFKKPQARSLLGLDKLAAKKREIEKERDKEDR